MSDIESGKTEASRERGDGKTEQKQTSIRLKLKDKVYRRLSETARAKGCSTEELVAHCVQQLLDS